jgi:SAM-dependent methyltransferase
VNIFLKTFYVEGLGISYYHRILCNNLVFCCSMAGGDIVKYRDKLRQFNSTSKYYDELEFLSKLLQPHSKKKILDYGCGIGTAVKFFQLTTTAEYYGYDVNLYDENADWFVSEIPEQIDKVYFMHSIAHIPYIEKLIQSLYLKNVTEVVVITPNRLWLEQKDKTGYSPDPTVIRHFDINELKELFESCGYYLSMYGKLGETLGVQNERLFLVAKHGKKNNAFRH